RTMRRREIQRRHETPRHVAVRVHRRGEQRTRPDDAAHRGGEVSLRVGQAHDGHRAVDIEEHSVERQRRTQALEQLRLHRRVEVALDRAAPQRARVDEGKPVDVPRQLVVSREQLVAADHGEIRRPAVMWRERARLDVDAADRDPVAHEPRSGDGRLPYRLSSVRFSTVTTASVTSAATAAIAAHTGSSSAPTTPSVSGTSMIVTPSRVLTSSWRAFPSSTRALIRSMTRSTPSSSMWNVSKMDSLVVGTSGLLLSDAFECDAGSPGRAGPSTSRTGGGFRRPRDTHV